VYELHIMKDFLNDQSFGDNGSKRLSVQWVLKCNNYTTDCTLHFKFG